MKHPEQWDWDSPRKEIPFASWQSQFKWVEEPHVSPDGESVAAIVNTGEGEFKVCINGATWETSFEKTWHLRFAPDGRLTAIVSESGEWTLAVDGVPWENRFGYVWEPRFSADGTSIAVKFQQDMRYGMAVNDAPWATTFANMTCATLSADGRRSAAAVQVENFGEADIAAFCERNYGVTFPLTAKIDVKGSDQHPVYQWLTTQDLNGDTKHDVKWNFHKFLVSPEGALIGSFSSKVQPLGEDITGLIR
jgi:hypothetical protein